MATKKDLVEAYSFSRRRLVTAFVSGAPGGREVEPSRPGRTVVGGVALAVLLIAGAAVTGVFKPRVDGDWTAPGLVTSKEKATDYLILEPEEGEDPVLRPLINITSAQLIFGADVEATRVPEDELTTLEVGPEIGILGAPGAPPDAEDLIQDGWTACTGQDVGIRVTVSAEPPVTPAPGTGFLVRSEGDLYVVGEGAPEGVAAPTAYSYPLRTDRKGLSPTAVELLTGSIEADAVDVPPSWLRLFPAGGALEPRTLGLGPIGRPVDYAGSQGIPAGARVGDYYEVGGTTYALARTGPTVLTPFAATLLRDEVGPDGELPIDDAPDIGIVDEPYTAARWPSEPLTAPAGDLCAVLSTGGDGGAGVRTALRPEDAASASEAEVPPDEIEPVVDSGAGAYVVSGQWDPEAATGEPHLVDSRGLAFLLQGPEVPALLGFGDVDAPVVPDPWIELFGKGVTLSVDAARCPPAPAGRGGRPCG